MQMARSPRRSYADEVKPGPALHDGAARTAESAEAGETADCMLEAEVTEMFGKGGTVQYRARTPSGQNLVVEIPGTSSLPMRIGDHVRLGWAKKDIYVFAGGKA